MSRLVCAIAIAVAMLVPVAAANHGPYNPGYGFGNVHWWHSKTTAGGGYESAPPIVSNLDSAFSRGGVGNAIWAWNNKPRNSPWFQLPEYTLGDVNRECADPLGAGCQFVDGTIQLYDGDYAGFGAAGSFKYQWFWRNGVAIPSAAHIQAGWSVHNLSSINHPHSVWCHELGHTFGFMHPTPQDTSCLTDAPHMFDGYTGNKECTTTQNYSGYCVDPDAHDIDAYDSAANHNEEAATKPTGVTYALRVTRAIRGNSGPPPVMGGPGETYRAVYAVTCVTPESPPLGGRAISPPAPFDREHCIVREVEAPHRID